MTYTPTIIPERKVFCFIDGNNILSRYEANEVLTGYKPAPELSVLLSENINIELD